MFLSIIIPIYNDEKYLGECLDSCLAQDLPLSDFEIICVDDGSTDSTPIILHEYEKKYPNIRTVFQEHGAASGRDIGLELAQGDYVWFVDHDDVIEPNVLAELKKRTACSGCERLVFPFYEFNTQFTEAEKKQRLDRSLDLSCNKRFSPDRTIWSSIFKREFLLTNNIWPRSRQVPIWRPVYGGDEFFSHECNDALTKREEWMDFPLYFHRILWGSGEHQTGKEATESKIKYYYNRSLSSMDKACQWREKYTSEKKQFGKATEDTTKKMMVWLREARTILSELPAAYRREGNKQLKEYGFDSFKKPEEYTYQCSTHLKNTAHTGSMLKRAAFYYSYNKTGARLYGLFSLKPRLSRAIKRSDTLTRIMWKIRGMST